MAWGARSTCDRFRASRATTEEALGNRRRRLQPEAQLDVFRLRVVERSIPKETVLGTVRLWLSLQRYALALEASVLALVWGAWMVELPWFGWVVLTPLLVLMGALAFHIHGTYRRKRLAMRLALRRQQRGSFDPDSLVNYCGDPCFRVVAGEILRLAGVSDQERRRRISELQRRHAAAQSQILVVSDGVVRTVDAHT